MPKTSVLQDRVAVTAAAAENATVAGALAQLGLRKAGGNYTAFNQACARYGLAVPGKPPAAVSRPRARPAPPRPAATPAHAVPVPAGHTAGTLPAADGNWMTLLGAVVTVAGLAAGTALVLAVQSGSPAGIAEAAIACLLVVLIIAF